MATDTDDPPPALRFFHEAVGIPGQVIYRSYDRITGRITARVYTSTQVLALVHPQGFSAHVFKWLDDELTERVHG